MKPIGQVVPKGHRLRLAVSSSYWPLAWPSPVMTTLSIDTAESYLDLPLVSLDATAPVTFGEAEAAKPGPVTILSPGRQSRSAATDAASGRITMTTFVDSGRYVLDDIGLEVTAWHRREYSIVPGDPASCRTITTAREGRARGEWSATLDTRLTVTCDRDAFHLQAEMKACEGDTVFAERTLKESIRRDFM